MPAITLEQFDYFLGLIAFLLVDPGFGQDEQIRLIKREKAECQSGKDTSLAISITEKLVLNIHARSSGQAEKHKTKKMMHDGSWRRNGPNKQGPLSLLCTSGSADHPRICVVHAEERSLQGQHGDDVSTLR